MTQLQQPSGCFSHTGSKRSGTAYILAGGKSRRLGRDKLFVQHNGTTLLAHAVNICSGLFHTVKIVAKNPDRFPSLGCEIVIDTPDADGPMAGIIAALQNCREDWCFITAADLPDLNREIITTIIGAYTGQQFVGLYEEHGPQMLCGVYHHSALPVLIARAKQGDYRMVGTLSTLTHKLLPVPVDTWRNVNTPADLQQLETGHD